jgi:hypothetical protein
MKAIGEIVNLKADPLSHSPAVGMRHILAGHGYPAWSLFSRVKHPVVYTTEYNSI